MRETDGRDGFSVWLYWLLWIVVAAAFVTRTQLNGATTPLFSDTDDAMRIVQARDFLSGQGWYDLVQHRLNTPFGAEIHWSRLVDLPIAALTFLLAPVAGENVTVWVGYVYPLFLLGPLLFFVGKLAVRLAGPGALLPSLALVAVSPAIMSEFSPGRMDHHSIQMILTAGLAWCTVEALRRPRFALGAGILAGLSLAVGTEGAPSVASAIAAFALMFVFLPQRADALRAFGLSFALGGLVQLVLALPPERWLIPMCDGFSIVYCVVALAVGLAFSALSVLPIRHVHVGLRLAIVGLFGAGVVLLVLALFPECRRGPYAAIDPWLIGNWIDRISEAKPIWQSLSALPSYVVSVSVPVLLALVVVLERALRDRARRGEWLLLGLFLFLAVVVMAVQVRGARLASVLALPAAAGLIVAARDLYLASRRKVLPILGLVLSWLAFAGVAIGMGVNTLLTTFPSIPTTRGTVGEQLDKQACLRPEAFAAVAALSPARLMTPIDLGAHMLLYSRHAVVAAPYHRNQDGVRDTFRFLNDGEAEARRIVDEREIDYVVICKAMPEMLGMGASTEDSIVRLLDAGRLPLWLGEISVPGAPLTIYRVAPDYRW